MNLPEGFVIDGQQQSAGVPEGFALDRFAEPLPNGRNFYQAREGTRDVGQGEAIGRGVAQGAAFNFYDELRGLMEAGGLNPNDPASLTALVTGAAKYWSGDKDAERRYNDATARERGIDTQAHAQNPVSSIGGNVAGAVASSLALPFSAALRAPTLVGRMIGGAGVGATTGALAGAGEGVGASDTLARAGTGTVIGGAGGAAIPAVTEGVSRVVQTAANPAVTAIRGALNPSDEAARRVATAIKRDVEIDPNAANRLTPREFVDDVQAGGPAAVMDLGGETTRALARSAANTSPEGRQALNDTINNRFEGQSGRITDWFRTSFNYPDAVSQQEAIEQAARVANRGAYAKAYADGSKGVWNQELDQLGNAPVMRKAIDEAATSIGNKTATGRAMYPITPDGKVTLEYWDQVKRSLDGMHSRLKRAGDTEAAADVDVTRKQLLKILDREVPSYAAARQTAARFFGAENALEAGQMFVRSNASLPEAAKALSRMTPQERKLFQDGFVSDYMAVLEKTSDRRDILNKIAESPQARAKLDLVLGRQKATELEAKLRVEGIMDFARNAVQGNSKTAQFLNELGFAGGAAGLTGIYGVANLDPTAAVTAGLLAGKRGIDRRVAARVAQMLASNDPQMLTRGIQLITKNSKFMDALRAADKRIASIGGNQSSDVPLLQSVMPGRAEGDE